MVLLQHQLTQLRQIVPENYELEHILPKKNFFKVGEFVREDDRSEPVFSKVDKA